MNNTNKSFIEYQLKAIGRKLEEIKQIKTSINNLKSVEEDCFKSLAVFIKNIEGEL